MQEAKFKLTKIVNDYIGLFPEEYENFKYSIEDTRHQLIDTKFGTAKGTGSEMRALFEMPVTLNDMIVNGLNEAEISWFKTLEGGRWFANTFKVFMVPEHA